MKYLLNYLKQYKRECVLAPAFKMLEALFDLFVPIIVANMVNIGIGNRDKGYIFKSCGLLILMAAIGLLCSFVAQYFAAKAATGSAAKMRHELFAHIQKLGFSEMDTIGTSTLITRMTSDINQVQNGINLFLRLFLRSPFIVIGAMVMAFTINVKIALVFAVAIPILSLIIFFIMRWTSPKYKMVQGKLDRVTAVTRENLSGVRVVRAFGKEESEIRRFVNANDELAGMQIFVGRISALMNPMTYVVVNIGIIAILYSGSNAVNDGILRSGEIIALINYMSQILVELVKLANLIVSVSKANASAGRVAGVLDIEPSMKYAAESSDEKTSDAAVEFDHVSLKYAGAGAESLTDISFKAMPGETIGIIGGTGSGKSSLVNLIPRFYDAESGRVTILGKPANDWSKEELRDRVGMVMQKAQLFSGTIRSNLLYGNEGAADGQLWDALKTAQAAEFVLAKPDGLDEKVEQGGRNLSGGQKQRLTIARALVKKPDILILDDSASALDFATDAALRKAIGSMSDKVTVFIVSQRTSSLQHADKILVLDDGNLVDCAPHDVLLERCEVYREIYESQFQKGEKRA